MIMVRGILWPGYTLSPPLFLLLQNGPPSVPIVASTIRQQLKRDSAILLREELSSHAKFAPSLICILQIKGSTCIAIAWTSFSKENNPKRCEWRQRAWLGRLK